METSNLYKLFKASQGVTTDTRKCGRGTIFFALKGASFNGNAFALQALEAGCAYAVVDEDVEGAEGNERIIRVDNVLKALQDLAHEHRSYFHGPVIQITGTNGKTTTKELTAAVLAAAFKVHYTQGNLNNHIGVPLTLLGLTKKHQCAVIETGANHPGEIDELSRIVDADYGLITNVGRAHLEGFGSFEGVVNTKTELYRYFLERRKGRKPKDKDFFTPPSVFVNGDNAILMERAKELPFICYGKPGNGYHVEGEVVECAPFLRLRWRAVDEDDCYGDWHEVQTQLIGAYNVDNVLAAISIGMLAGVEDDLIDEALENYHPTNSRSELRKTEYNTLIVDAYNANASSMKVALENFGQVRVSNDEGKALPKMAILGEMRELGDASAEEHRKVVEQALSLHLDTLWLVGEEFVKVAKALPTEEQVRVRVFGNVEEVMSLIAEEKPHAHLILIKGSNGTRLHKLPELL